MTGGALDAHIVVDGRAGFHLDVSITAAPGEIVAVMGPSGAGKTTVMSAIAGLVRIDDGAIRIDEREVASTVPRRHVPAAQRGVVLLGQDPRLFPHLTARENVAFGPRARGVARSAALGDADAWLERVGLPGAGARHPAQLSGGQQQRVAIARALATSPRVLLLDEPLTALDTETASEIRALLHAQLSQTRSTTVIVTHSTIDAAALAHRLVIIEAGRVSQQGPVLEVLATPASRFAAALAGLNRIVGVADGGQWRARGGGAGMLLSSSDPGSQALLAQDGVALAALVSPGAVRLAASGAHEHEPGSWPARVVRFEQTPSGARVHTAEPQVAVDVTAGVIAALELEPGVPVRLTVDPADVRLARIPESAGTDAEADLAAVPASPRPGSAARA